ncbi:hypothetical protein [Haloferula sp. BvORR071]|uniref:hypothetical protein n=1 Tax=Haloferula sp. BvORR071 TaxID=1396141 RepID=UPI00054D00D9|nr:hypothetical protein [Haloferula sp. BvORR071]
MKIIPISGLLLAFGTSYLLAGLFAPSGASSAAVAPSVPKPIKAEKASTRITSQDLLAAVDSTPMSPTDRYLLRYDQYDKWAESDPLGMLASLKGKAVPEIASLSSAFANLAETRPAELLRYAREQGCTEAIETLLDHCDPRQSLTTLLANTSYSYPAEIYEKLFKQGEQLDPEFHRRISELPDDAGRAAAFSAAAKVMLESKRHDDYFALLAEYPESAGPERIAEDFAKIVVCDPARMAQFDTLPPEAQSGAIDQILSGLDSLEDSGQTARSLLPEYARHGWLDERRSDILELIMEDAVNSEDSAAALASGKEWKDWALALPSDGSCDYLRQAGIARWAAGEPGDVVPYQELPTPELQDAARIGTLMVLTLQENYAQAKAIAGGLHNSARREQLILAIQGMERGEDVDEFDPFAPIESPE